MIVPLVMWFIYCSGLSNVTSCLMVLSREQGWSYLGPGSITRFHAASSSGGTVHHSQTPSVGCVCPGGGARGVHHNTSSQGGAGRAGPQPQRGSSLQTGLTSPCRPHLLGEGSSQGGMDMGFPGALGASLAAGRREG